MMSHDNNIGATKPGGNNKDGTHISGGGGGKKSSSSSLRPPSEQPPPPSAAALKCPRCDSPNTKFCYYNNYSLTQPRHFCKTCRRYWTKGGALRNVPIGGGCRRNKKMKSSSNSSTSSSRFSGDSSSSCSDIGGLKFFNGLSPAMDFQLGGINLPPRSGNIFNNINNSQNLSLFRGSSSSFNLDPLGFNGLGFQEMGSQNLSQTSNIASSIESLSCINQDLHWKLQQQRLAVLFGDNGGGDQNHQNDYQHEETNSIVSNSIQLDHHHHPDQNDHQGQKLLQPILFHNLEISPKDHHEPVPIGDSGKDCGGSRGGDGGDGGGVNSLATEWFFENCYAPVNVNVNPTPTTSNSAGNDQNGSNNWNGIQAWSNLNQYSALP